MPVSTSLRGRVPGQAVIADIVAVQRQLPERTAVARIFGTSPLTPSTRGLYRAALGEVTVGEMLDQLGTRWDVLHVVPITDADVTSESDASSEGLGAQIDHLVIGPPGVFAVMTENYPGQEVKVAGDTMTIGGHAVDDIVTARRLAGSAAERLSAAAGHRVTVEPVIVVIDSGKLSVREQPTGVTIVGSKQLLRLLTKLDRVLDGSVVAHISDVAERVDTWEATATPPEQSVSLTHDFVVLREQVRDATQSRIFWGVIGFAIICASAWISTVLIVEKLLEH